MWLLSTDRAELKYFNGPEDVPDGYAILSHVWSKPPHAPEQTFQEVQYIYSRCTPDQNPRDYMGPKIRECCVLAQRHGYKWVWNDTCCIDKSSSAELSEAINSMFHYYSRADICYAYLADVDAADGDLHRINSQFQRSEWHKRGWTLQELLAPEVVLFVSSKWELIGTKADLSEALELATGIPVDVLTLLKRVHDASLSQRMSWALSRVTTRLEDRAYCLMGIFGVNMPTLYGEGVRAFHRLQIEIMKQSTDPSLLVWGTISDKRPLQYWAHSGGPDGYPRAPPISFTSLLASSPFVFPSRKSVRHTPHEEIPSLSFKATKSPTFAQTPHGFLTHVPVITDDQNSLILILFCTLDGRQVGLHLYLRSDALSPIGPLYGVVYPHRLVYLDELPTPTAADGTRISPEWRDVYISDRIDNPRKALTSFPINRSFSSPFHIPPRHLAELNEKWLMRITQVPLPKDIEQRLIHGWNGCPPFAFVCCGFAERVTFLVRLGRCCVHDTDNGGYPADRACAPGEHWATAERTTWSWDTNNALAEEPPSGEHDCSSDHISGWHSATKSVEIASVAMRGFDKSGSTSTPQVIPERKTPSLRGALMRRILRDAFVAVVTLSFTPSRINPQMFVLNLELKKKPETQ